MTRKYRISAVSKEFILLQVLKTRLSELAKQEEIANIRNGVNYARKVLATGECDLLILDEVLGLLDQEIVLESELDQVLDSRGQADVILTGRVLPENLSVKADQIDRITRIASGREM